MSHTPGPWVAECVGCTNLENPEDIYEVGTEHVRVCEYVAERDARLIAAAPELLEALKEARGFINSDYTGRGGRDLSSGALARIDAVIAKAEGK